MLSESDIAEAHQISNADIRAQAAPSVEVTEEEDAKGSKRNVRKIDSQTMKELKSALSQMVPSSGLPSVSLTGKEQPKGGAGKTEKETIISVLNSDV